MSEEPLQESAIVNAIERLIDAKIWLDKIARDDHEQLFHAGNEYQGAKHELANLLDPEYANQTKSEEK